MSQLAFSIFHEVFFPDTSQTPHGHGDWLRLERLVRHQVLAKMPLQDLPLVIFDFETTGLDTQNDYVIEIGALRVVKGAVDQEFSSLIKPPVAVTPEITAITGITGAMLEDQPTIEAVLPGFLKFIENAVLVAHNAAFDCAFLQTICARQGIRLDWPAFCTVKLARFLLPQLESRSLDALAGHYGLSFEARHRSIGDCKVTHAVLQRLLAAPTGGAHGANSHAEDENQELTPQFSQWQHLQPFVIK